MSSLEKHNGYSKPASLFELPQKLTTDADTVSEWQILPVAQLKTAYYRPQTALLNMI